MRAQARSRLPSYLSISALWISRAAAVSVMTGALSLLAGCNSVSGAGDLKLIDPDEFEDDSDDDSSGGVNPTGGGGGAGGGAATACVYPEGTYGTQLDDIATPDLTWKGYAEGSTTVEQVTDVALKDYYDCDGSKGINAVLILTSATWCGYCDQEASSLNSHMETTWAKMGIRVITLMIEDASSKPATLDTAFQWKSTPTHDLVSTAVVADPAFSFQPMNGMPSVGLPVIIVLDPRTMKIINVQEGAPGNGQYPELEALAEKNASSSM